ncbi:fibronectin type III domain-containing protein [Hymenobacter negativus]|uniref:Fibronectin type III domain-containing protein n=1 Tax=Hymenobacter negativus TaxID=2795026 RepID=A0ABS0QBF5_9BACT|nr:fibronectin type III domain-containing protein [Hymenobacter negativus]MBH8560032.1 fibronectin type III domain-containing protein [Hymenobacter negativus]
MLLAALLFGSGPAQAQTTAYCATGLGGVCGGNDITDVGLSGTTLNATGLTCAATGGQSYTSYPATGNYTGTISGGVPYTLSVTLTGSSIVSVWVDYNHNFVYEASEWTQVTTNSPTGTPASVTLLVPTNAVQGTTGMRIRSRGASNANGATDACTNFGSGETKDFTLTVGAPAACPSVSGLAVSGITASGASVAFTPSSSATSYTVTVTPAGGTPTTQTATASPIALTGLTASTSYTVSIVGNCGAGQTSAANTITFTTGCATAPYATVNNTTAYTQDFEATWLNVCATRDAPDANWRTLPLTGNNTWRREDDGASAAWTGPTSGAYSPTGSPLNGGTSAHSARFHSYNASSGTRGTMDLSVNMAGTAGTPTLQFDYINTSGTDSLKVFVSTNGGTSFSTSLLSLTTASTWTRQSVNLPATGLTATTIIRLRATSDFGVTDIGVDNVRVSYITCPAVTAATATGITATGATVSFTPASASTNYTVTITPTGGTATTQTITASPLTLTGLTPSTSYTVSIVGNCGAGSTSQPTVVTFTTGCLAAPYVTVNNTTPYTQDFEATWLSQCGTRDVPGVNWRTTPLTGNTSWRREDDGTSAAWSSTSGAYTPAGSPLGGGTSAHSARFHSYDATSGTRGTMDLYVNMAGTVGTPSLEFDYINTSGSDSLKVFVSTDGGTTFGPALLGLNLASTWTHQLVSLPTTGLTATTVIRLRGRGDFGVTDIGVDNVRVSYIACAAITGLTSSGVTATGAVLTFTPPAGPTTYTVTVTPAGGTATTVTPAPSASPITLTGLTPNTVYTVSIVSNCSGGTTSTATTTTFTTSCAAAPYVLINNTTPYNQDFEAAWTSQCGTNEIPAVNWRNTPLTGNNSWRRDDDGASAAWTSPASGAYAPLGSPLGTGTSLHSARFHSYNVSGRARGSLDLFANMAGTSGTPVLTFDYINTSGTDSLNVFVSTNGGTTFGAALIRLGQSATWTRQTLNLPITGLTATTIIRLRAVGDLGLTDIGLDNVNVTYVACAAVTGVTATGITASTATINFNPTSGPTNYTVTVTPASGTPTTQTVTTSPVSLTGLTASTSYTVSIVGNCGAGQTSAATTVTFTTGCLAAPYATVNNTTAYTQDFEAAWLSLCGTNDAPAVNWRNTPVTGNNSWRREDDGASAAWTGPTSGAYSPAGSPLGTGTSAHSARFHTYNASSGTRGTLDLSVNMAGTAGTPTLEFDYINTSGSDSLKVFVSTNGGTSFSASLRSLTTASTWTHQTVNLPATGLTATTIIRLRATSDFGVTDIGVDNVRVSYITCPAVTAVTATGLTTTGATVNFTPSSASTNYTVTITPAGGTATTQTITASPLTLTGLTPGTSYTVSIVSNCGGSQTSQPATITFNTLAVAPVNDDCAGALNVPIQFGTCITQTTSDNTAATTSAGAPTPSCSTTLNRDVWFKVTVPVSGSVTVKTVAPTAGSNITDTVLSLYSGTCGNLTEIGCNDDTNGLYSQVALTGRTPGEVLYIRAWSYSTTNAGLIAVCVTAPSNCAAPSGPTVTGLTNTTATLNWLAPTGGLPAGNTYELEYGPQGFTQGTGTSVTGLTAATYALTNLQAATDYCFYVRQNCGTVNGSSSFVGPTCFTTPLTAPANDEPCGAVALGTTTVTGSNVGSTTSIQNGINTPACSPAALPKDVWFSFIATTTSRTLTITGTAAGMVRVFTTPSCSAGPFNQVFCQAATGSNLNVGPVRLTGLTVGTTYYVAVSGYGSSDTTGSFTILSTPTATSAQANTDALLVYPNPSNTGQLTLRLSGLNAGGQATLLNALGQVVATKALSGTAEQTLSTRGLATGLYTLRVTVGGQVLTRKVVLE